MAFDGFFCIAVANEIDQWTGARVDRLHFCSQNSLCLSLYRFGKRTNLLIYATASRPIIALSDQEPIRPGRPTGMCMLFRKHLLNSRLVSVTTLKNERIICFTFDSADDLGYISKKYIYAEMMGKYSNIILCSHENRILGASSVVDITASVRQVMAGMLYELPPAQNKIELSAAIATKQVFLDLVKKHSEKRADSFLVSTFFSFSPLIAREVVFLACNRTDVVLGEVEGEDIFRVLCKLNDIIENKKFEPYLVKTASGEVVEYSFMHISQYGNSSICEKKPSFSELLLDFYGKKAEDADIKQYASDIMRTVNSALSRLQRKIDYQRQELEDCRKKEIYKKEGDLLTANLYRLQKQTEKVRVYDYQIGSEIEIKLDNKLSPAMNAQKKYKKYTKLKRAETILSEQIKKAQQQTEYLRSVLDFIKRAASVVEFEEIRRELIDTGYIAEKKKAGRKHIPSQPHRYKTSNGFVVKAGRNNKENDNLTAAADKNDIWFHIKGFHGSHVILYTGGEEPAVEDYTEAAQIAAYHSEKRGSSNVAVDYTRVRYLKKPNGSPPGFITYEKYWTAFVNAKLREE